MDRTIAHIFIVGVIGEFDFFDFSEDNQGNTLSDVRRQFNSYSNPTEVIVHIDSPGGDMDEGFGIHDYLVGLPQPVTTIVEGSAYSIATAIMLAGDKGKRLAFENASIGIHNPSPAWPVSGDSKKFEKMAAELRRREEMLLDLYEKKTNSARADLAAWMDNETFMGTKEAIDAGFLDGIQETVLQKINKNFATPLKAVAFISNTNMNEEQKKAKGLFSELSNLLSKFKNESEKEVIEAPEQPEEQAPEWEAEKAELMTQIEELKNQLEAKETETMQAVEAYEAKIKNQQAAFEKIEAKIKELESMPIIQAKQPEKTVVESEPSAPSPWDKIANNIKKQYVGRA